MVDDPRHIPSDQELLQLVEDINKQLPYLGEVMVMGRLRSMGYYVTRSRLRLAIRDVDPINRALRWGGNVRARHPYSVPGPNSLWHIGKCYCTWVTCVQVIYMKIIHCFPDGHHKLIRWRFVTHAGNDGYSRMIVYMKCSTNNRAVTVVNNF